MNGVRMKQPRTATIADIVRETGISRGTVDRVLHNRGKVSPEKEELIRRCAEEMGYKVSIATKSLAVRKQALKIGFCYFSGEGALFFQEAARAAEEYAERLMEYNVNVIFYAFEWLDPKTNEPLYRQMSEDGLDGCVTVGLLADQYSQYAEEHKITVPPCITYNIRASKTDHVIAHVGCDYEQSGRMACGLAAMILQEKGNVGIVSSWLEDAESYKLRVKGFREEMEAVYPELQIADTYVQGDRQDMFDFYLSVEKMLSEHPEIDVIYLVNPGDYSVCRAMIKSSSGRRIPVITNDMSTDEQAQMIRKGEITAAVCQNPGYQGTKPLELMFHYLALEEEPEKENRDDLIIRIRQNV